MYKGLYFIIPIQIVILVWLIAWPVVLVTIAATILIMLGLKHFMAQQQEDAMPAYVPYHYEPPRFVHYEEAAAGDDAQPVESGTEIFSKQIRRFS